MLVVFEEQGSGLRAHGGCLGCRRRGRTWLAAISLVEVRATFEARISEWGNPLTVMSKGFIPCGIEGEPGELKHLSTWRRRKQ